MKKKIAIVVQRYGADVNGGAELHARLLAEHLKDLFDIDVLTSCAKNHITWQNEYKEGLDCVNGINVLRFAAEKKNRKRFRKLSHYLYRNLNYAAARYTFFNFPYLALRKFIYRKRSQHLSIFNEWVKEQGPYCKELPEYIAQHKKDYQAFIFFTYLYYPTYFGIEHVKEKSILIPTAHDEPQFYFSGFEKLFDSPRCILYNTDTEKHFVESVYPHTRGIQSDVVGIGIDIVNIKNKDSNKHKSSFPYFIYIGRIDRYKGVDMLILYFKNFKIKYPSDLKLVLVGNNEHTNYSSDNDIIFTGFISDEEKDAYLENSLGLIIPSFYESLSMVTLEAMAEGKPVLVNGKCNVLKEHAEKSKVGFCFDSENSFIEQLDAIINLTESEKQKIETKSRSYIDTNYSWSKILTKFVTAINEVTDSK